MVAFHHRWTVFVCLVFVWQTYCPLYVLAEHHHEHECHASEHHGTPAGDSLPSSTGTSTNNAASPSLDLSSEHHEYMAPNTSTINVVIGGNVENGAVVGGNTLSIEPGQMVTAATYAAILGIVGSGYQSLLLSPQGTATGGFLSVTSDLVNGSSGLTIPTGVIGYSIGNTQSDPLNVAGSSIINGSLYALQNQANAVSVLQFGNLTIGQDGLLSGALPSSLSFLTGLFSSAGLQLNITDTLTNYGTITTPGNLAIQAGSSIINESLAGTLASIMAQTVSMTSNIGQIINSGSIAATAGNLNIAAAMSTNLLVNNIGGVLSASDAINIRDMLFDSTNATSILGGDLLSKELNIFGGYGGVDVQVDNISGIINITAETIAVTASAPNLIFGNILAGGDPLLANINGDVTITGSFGAGGDSSIIASGDVLAQTGSSINLTTPGSDLFIVSGANIQGAVPPYTITGPKSPTGGKIDLTGMISISTAGGSVTMAAYDGGNVDSGRIIIPNAVITTQGGDVTLIGSDRNAANVNAIAINSVNTTGGAPGSGNITLKAADLPSNVNIMVDASGAVTGLNQITGFNGAPLPRNIVVTGSLIANGAQINLLAGDGTANGNIFIGGQINNNATAGNAGSVTITQNSANPFVVGNATVNGIVGTPANQNAILVLPGAAGTGGTVSITNLGSGGITVNNMNVNIQATATAGAGANYTFDATGGTMTFNGGGTLDARALGSGNGGEIKIFSNIFTNAGGLSTFTADGAGTGSGGLVQITSAASGNNINIGATSPAITLSARGGSGGSDGGTIIVKAGGNLTVNVNQATAGPQAGNGAGGAYSFQAGAGGPGNLLITGGNLSANGLGTGNGGQIELISNSATTFSVNGAAVNGISGAFGLSARSGTTGGNGGRISIINNGAGGITINSAALINVSPQAAGAGGNLTLTSSAGTITLAPGTYNAAAGGGNNAGGSLDITGNSVVIAPSGTVILNANATGSGNGGSITLKSTGVGQNILIASAAASQFNLLANGGSAASAAGDGGSITVYAGGNLTVQDTAVMTAAPLGNNGAGAIYDLQAGSSGSTGNLYVNGSINANANGTGNGGSITLTTRTNGATPFVIGSTATTVGVLGTIAAMGGTTSGNAGTAIVINNGNSGIRLDLTTNIDVHATNGDAGEIILNAAVTPGTAGNITIPGGTLDVSATAGNSNGGRITIIGNNWLTSGSGILNLVASGFGSGSGGMVSFETISSTSDLTVGGGTNPSLNIQAMSGNSGGNGGSITVKAGRHLTIENDSANFDANPQGTDGAGQSLTFNAGNSGGAGNLFVRTSLFAQGAGTGNGGSIHLETNSASLFNIGLGSLSPGVDGILNTDAGNTSGQGGNIYIQNNGSGGINIGATTNISANASAGAAGGGGGSITLDAGAGNLTIPLSSAPGGATLNAGASGPGPQNGGTITLNGNSILLPNSGQTLTLDVHGVGNGNAGTVNTTQGSGAINFDGTAGNFQIDARSGDGAIINIRTPGTLTYDPNVNLYLPLDPNGEGAYITLNSTNGNLLVTGSLDASGNGTGNGGLISLSSNSPDNTPFTIDPSAVINGVQGTLKADGGPAGGNAGSVEIFDHAANGGSAASQGIIVGDTTNISASASNGRGGNITLISDNRTVEFQSLSGGTTLDANAGGGNFRGGNIVIQGTRIDSIAIAGLTYNANGSGTGSGGTIHLTATDSVIGSIALGTGGGQVQLNALSGTGTTAHGGSITIDAAVDITGSSTAINANSIASSNGNGGTLKLHAGNSGNGHIQIDGSLTANAKGTGNGGLIEITAPFSNNFQIGGTTSLDYVSGIISANAPITGTGGTINIVNTRSGAPLNVDFAMGGLLDAGSAQGIIGNVNFLVAGDWITGANPHINPSPNPAAGESITVQNLVAGAGQINGFVTAIATNVAIKTDAPDARIDIGTMRTNFATAAPGTINIESSNGSGIVSIGEGHQLIAADNVTITTVTFIDNTTIFQSLKNNGQIIIQSPTGKDLFVKGEGYLTLRGTGAGNLIRFAVPDGQTLRIENNLTLQPNDDLSRIEYLAGVGGTVILQAGRTQIINDGADVFVRTPTFEMGAGSSILASPPGGRTTNITVDTGLTGSALTFILNGNASLIAGGASNPFINIGPTDGTANGQDLHFINNTANPVTLSLLGGDVTTHIKSTASLKATETIDTDLTISSDHNILMTADQEGIMPFISEIQNNGRIVSTLSGGNITAQSNGDLQISGSNGIWQVSGSGANQSINLRASVGSATGHQLNIGGSQTYNPGAGGTILFDSPFCPDGSVNISGTQLITNTAQNVQLTINTGLVTLADITNLTVQNNVAAAVGLNITCPTGCDLTIQAPSGGTATLQTAGARFQIGPSTAGNNLNFSNSGLGVANLLFRGGTVTTNTSAGGTQAVANNVNLNANNTITMNVDNGTLANNGTIGATTAANAPGQITIQSSVGNLDITSLGNILVNPSGVGPGIGGTIRILDLPGNLSIQSGALNASAVGPGNFAGGTITVTAQSIAINGGNLTLQADGSGTSQGGTINITATANTGDINVGGATGNFNIIARGGTGGGNGGVANVSAGRDLRIVTAGGSSFNVSPQAGNGSGGTINLTASTAGAATAGSLILEVDLDTNGIGSGNGGIINLINHSNGGLIDVQGLLTANSGTTGGRGGNITIRNNGGGTVTSAISLASIVSATTVGNSGFGTIIIDSSGAGPGIINITSTSISANNIGTAGRGGEITITGRNLSLSGGVAHAITADGPSAVGGTGNGGQITLNTSSNAASNITLNAGPGGLTLSAHSGSNGGNGGTLTVTAGNNITLSSAGVVDAGVVSGTGNGGSIFLTGSAGAGSNGVVLVNPTLTVNGGVAGGNGGRIEIINNSNAANAIVINGGTDSLLANGGTGGIILVRNNGRAGSNGGIQIQGNVSATSSVTGNPANNRITVDATGNGGGITNFVSGQVIANVLSGGNGTGGTILIQGADFSLGGTAGVISSNGAGNGNGGSITITANGAASNISLGTGAGSFAITANATGTGSGGSIIINAGHDIDITAAAILQANASTTGTGGSITLNGSTSSTNGKITVAAPISTNGAGVGNGGSIVISNNSSVADAILISQPLTVNAGTTGSGGRILITNFGVTGGNGGIRILAGADLSAQSNGANALLTTGVTVDAQGSGANPHGIVTLENNNINVNGNGTTGSGGTILVRGAGIALVGLVPKTLTANAAGGSNGGQITFTSLSASQDIDLTSGPGLILRAQGGSLASATGDGGSITVNSGRSINFPDPATQILANALGNNGRGGTIILRAGNAAAGNLIVGGDLNADGVGTGQGGTITASLGTVGAGLLQIGGKISANGGATGNGGTVNVTYNDPTNPLHVGIVAAGQSYINGTVSADGGTSAATTGGNVTIATNANAGLNVDLSTVISANRGTGGTYGILTFDKAGQAVNVAGPSQLIGQVSAHGTSINIDTQATSATITVRSIVASNGNVSLSTQCPTGTIEIGPNATIASPLVQANSGTVSTFTEFLTMSGTGLIQSTLAGGVSNIRANIIAMSGSSSIRSTGANSTLNIQSCCAPANALTIQFAGTSQIIASGANSDVNFNPTANGAITINTTPGTGTISATRSVSFGGGNGTGDVLVDVNTIVGTISGTGHLFSIRTTNGSLTANGINTSNIGSHITLNATAGGVNASNVSGAGNIIFTGGNGGVTANTATTSDGEFTATANNGAIVATAINSTGTLRLINNSANQSITANGIVQSNLANIIIQTTGNNGTFVNNGSVSGQTGVLITTPSVTLNAGASVTAVNNNLDLQSNSALATGILSVSMANGSTLTATSGDVRLNPLTAGQINFTSTNNGNITGNNLVLNGNNQNVLVDVRSIAGTVRGVGVTGQAGSAVTVNVQTNPLIIGLLRANTSITLRNADTAAGAGNISFIDNVTAAGGLLRATTGNNSTLSINSGLLAQGNSVLFTTPTLNLLGTASVSSTTGNINVDSNSPGANPAALNVVMGSGSSFNSAAAVNFNQNAVSGGQITVNGPGSINGTSVGVNGGDDAVSITVDSVSCCVQGLGAVGPLSLPLAQRAPLGGSSITLSVNTGTTGLGAIYSPGAITVTNNDITGSVQICGNVVGDSVFITTPSVVFTNPATISSTANGVSMQSNAGGMTNTLSLTFVAGSGISALGQSVNFNPNTPGQIQTLSSALGDIAAGTLGVNGGTNSVVLNVNSANCCIVGLGPVGPGSLPLSQQAPLGGSSVSITVASGSTGIGPLYSPGAISVTNNNTSASGNIDICGDVVGDSVSLTAPAVTFTAPDATISSLTGGVSIQGNRLGTNALNLSFTANSGISAPGQNITLNASAAGPITTLTSALGDITAASLGVNGGSGSVNLNVNSISCCVIGLGASTGPMGQQAPLGGSNVSVQVASGNIGLGPIAATNNLTALTTDPNGNADVCGNLVAGNLLSITSGNNGSTNIPTATFLNGGSVLITTPTLNLLGTASVSSTAGNINIDSNSPGANPAALNVVMGSGSSFNSAAAVNFNQNAVGGGQITVNGPGSINGTSVGINGGDDAVSITVDSISCCVNGLGAIGPLTLPLAQQAPLGGSSITLSVNTGTTGLGAIYSPGAITVTNNDITGSVQICGNVVGDSVAITAPAVTYTTASTISSTANGVSMQSNAGGVTNTLSLTFVAGSGISAPGQSVNFNPNTPGQIQTLSTALGDIFAGSIGVNGGTNSVVLNVNSANCCIIGLGPVGPGSLPLSQQAPLGGSSVSITVASGSTGIGPLYSPGAISVTNNNTSASGNIDICGDVVGDSVSLTAPAVTFTAPDVILSSLTGGVSIQGNRLGTNALNLSFTANSGISAPGQNVTFNASAAGPITTLTSALGDITAASLGVNGGSGSVNLNVNSISCCVIGLGASTGPMGQQAPLGGSNVSVQVASGNIGLGPIAATTNLTALTTDPNGNADVCGNLVAGNLLSITSGNNGSTNIPTATFLNGGSVLITTPTLNLLGTASVSSTAGNINVDSNSPGANPAALNVVMGSGSSFNSPAAVNFNQNAVSGGQITVNGPGSINGTSVGVNGGDDAVSITVDSISCCVNGLGAIGPLTLPLAQQAPLGGSSITLSVNTGTTGLGAIYSPGAITVTNNDITGSVQICGNVVGDSVFITTPSIVFTNPATISSTANGVSMQSNAGGMTNTLSLTFVTGSGISALGQAVNFNPNTPGQIQTLSTALGDIFAGSIGVNGGTNSVVLNVNSANCCIVGLGPVGPGSLPLSQQAPLGGSSISITVASGSTGIGPLYSPGAISVTNNNTSASGNIDICGDVVGDSISLTAPAVTFTAPDVTISSLTGGVSIQGNRLGTNALNLSFTANSGISAPGQNITLNAAAAGPITTLTSALGDITAASLGVNGGSDSVNLNVNSISCCVIGLGASTGPMGQQAPLGGSNVSVQVASGNIGLGPIAATNNLTALTTDPNGNADVCGNLVAGNLLSLTSGNNGSTNIPTATFLNGGSVLITTPTLNLLGTASVSSTAGNINIDSNSPGANPAALNVVMGSGSSFNSAAAVNFNQNAVGGGQITVNGPGSINGTSVGVNGGDDAVSITVDSISCCVQGLGAVGPLTLPLAQQAPLGGSSITLSVNTGNFGIGPLYSPGAITATNNNTTGSVEICGNVVGDSVAITASAVTYTTASTISSTANGVSMQSNAGGMTNTLSLTFVAGSGISALGQSVNFNPNTPGQIQTLSTALGDIAAGTLGVNGGTNSVVLNVNSANCCIVGLGPVGPGSLPLSQQAPLGGSSISITVASGSTGIGPLYSPGAISVTNNNTSASGNIDICGDVVGDSISLTAPAVTFTAPDVILSSLTGGVSIQGNRLGTNALNLSFTANSGISAPGQNVTFNASAAGPITTLTSALGDITAASLGVNGGSGSVNLNVNSISCCVIGLGASTGPMGQQAPLGGSNVSVQVASGNIGLGPIAATNNLTALTTDPNGNTDVCGNLVAGNLLSLTSGNNGSTNIPTATFLNGGSVLITTPTLNLLGTASVSSTTGNINIDSNSPGANPAALNVVMGSGSSFNSAAAVNFNQNAVGGGQITVNGPGSINGTSVGVNGGDDSVSITVDSVSCCVNGLGAVGPLSLPLAQRAPLGGSSITLSVNTGTTGLGAIYSPGAITVTNNDTTGSVQICGNVVGDSVFITTPSVIFTNPATISSTANGVSMQSNAGGLTNTLSLTFVAGSGISALGQSVNFNPNTPGQIQTLSTALGDIFAGSIGVNGGTNSVVLNVNSANCCIVGLGPVGPGSLPLSQQAPLGGSSISITVASGSTGIGPLYSPGAISLTNNNTSASGNIDICGDVVGDSISLTAPAVTFTAPDVTISSLTGGVSIQGNRLGTNALNLSFTANSGISAPGQNITLNAAAAGPITTLTSALGDITAASLGVNGGSDSVNLNVNSISCCVIGLGASTGPMGQQAPLGGLNVSVQVASGNIGLGPIAATNNLTALTTDPNGNADVCGNLVAGNLLSLTSGNNGSTNIPTATFLNGGSVLITTPTLNLLGTASVSSTAGNINIDSNSPGANPAALNIVMGSGSSFNSAAAVNFNENVSGGGQITVNGPGSINGTSVGVNGGDDAVSITVDSISCCVQGLGDLGPLTLPLAQQAPLGGSSITLSVTSGDIGVGPLYSPGSIQVTNNNTIDGKVNICGNVVGSDITLTTPNVTYTGSYTISSTEGNVILQSNVPLTRALEIVFAPDSGISAPEGAINFNPLSPGSITAVGDNGDLNAKSVGVNGGIAGNVTLELNSINCCVRGLGPDRPTGSGIPLGGNNVKISVQIGNMSIGPLSAVGLIDVSTADPDGTIVYCGSIEPFAPEEFPVAARSITANLATNTVFGAGYFPFVFGFNDSYITDAMTQNDLSNNQIFQELETPLVGIFVCVPRKLYFKKPDKQLPDLNDWILVDNDKQPFGLVPDDAFILAEMGAQFNYSAKATVLQRAGRLAIFSGKDNIALVVGQTRIVLNSQSVLIVNVTNQDSFTGICAAGNATYYGQDKQEILSLKARDQVVVTSAATASGTNKLSASLQQVSADLLAADALLKKDICCDPLQKRRLNDVRESLQADRNKPQGISLRPLPAEPQGSDISSSSSFRGIAFQQIQTLEQPKTMELKTVVTEGFDLFAVGSHKYTLPTKQHLILQDGEILIDAKQDIVIEAGEASFSLSRGTIASFIKSKDVVAVRNISDTWGIKPTLQVSVGGKSAGYVQIGNEMIISSKNESIDSFVTSDLIGRRRSSLVDYPKHNVSLANCEFSLVSYCLQSPLLIQLVRTDGQAHQLAKRIMKAAASINMATASHGSYSAGNRSMSRSSR